MPVATEAELADAVEDLLTRAGQAPAVLPRNGSAVPSVPDLLPEQDWLSLEDGKRASHDEERLEHHSRLVVVQTPVIGRIITQGGNLIRMNRLARYGRSGLMVSGPGEAAESLAAACGSTAALPPARHLAARARNTAVQRP